MPGIAPSWASSRRQIRQSPNFLKTARGRPQRLQREYFRTGNRGVRDAFTISDFLAIPLLLSVSWLAGEREAEPAQQREALLVGRRRRRDRDVEAADGRDVVVVDLGEDDLLADTDRVVAAPVERARVEAAEVADAREGDRDEPVEEVVHPVAAQRHARPDRHPLADLEARDRFAGTADLRPLPGDPRQLLDRAVECLRLGLGLAHAHVQRYLGHARNLHHRAQAELLLELRGQRVAVELLEARD